MTELNKYEEKAIEAGMNEIFPTESTEEAASVQENVNAANAGLAEIEALQVNLVDVLPKDEINIIKNSHEAIIFNDILSTGKYKRNELLSLSKQGYSLAQIHYSLGF